jgi:hypothetical protein
VLLSTLGDPDVRNFYGWSRGQQNYLLGTYTDTLNQRIAHRYLFVFADGDLTGSGGGELFTAFGADDEELACPVYPAADAALCGPPITTHGWY